MKFMSFGSQLTDRLRANDVRFAITGGGGWLGQATLEMLDQVLGAAFAERVSVFGSKARDIKLRSGRAVPCFELKEIVKLPRGPHYYLHYAFLTKDKLTTQSNDTFIRGNDIIRSYVIEAINNNECCGLFLPSSGAVYRADGKIDTDIVANAYGVMKAQDENIFSALATKQNFPAVIPRVFNLSGPYMNKVDLYALGSMLRDALADRPIVINAAHRVLRSYVHVADVIRLAISMLLEAQNNISVFDTAGDQVVELSELAQQIRTVLNMPHLEIKRPVVEAGKENRYIGRPGEMAALAKRFGFTLCSLGSQIEDTASWLLSA